MKIALTAFTVVTSIPLLTISASDHFNVKGGKPSDRPLPAYCQMGECVVETVEAIDPIAFAPKGVLFRVESQNWKSSDTQKMRRDADTTSYVLCSKSSPAVVFQSEKPDYLVTFLAPNDGSKYGHFNETDLAIYFVVCHARLFDTGSFYDEGPTFAVSLGYAVTGREDQPRISSPEKVMEFLK